MVDDPELGQFIGGLGGGWRHSCTVDFPFQTDVDLIFDLHIKTPDLPESMPRNVAWIQEHFADIWNAAAAALNKLSEVEQIEGDDEFALDSLYVELPNASVETAKWQFLIEPSYVQGSFKLTFQGINVVDQKFEGP